MIYQTLPSGAIILIYDVAMATKSILWFFANWIKHEEVHQLKFSNYCASDVNAIKGYNTQLKLLQNNVSFNNAVSSILTKSYFIKTPTTPLL